VNAVESVEAAVATLVRLDLRELVEEPQVMAEALIERQYALDFLKLHPLSSDSESSELRRQLEDVSRRDAETMQLLSEAKAHIDELMGNVVSGRAMVRGYGGLSANDSSAGIGGKRVG
jgi:hypothetical protein